MRAWLRQVRGERKGRRVGAGRAAALRARRGTVLLEFALVGPLFLFVLVFILEAGYDLYAQEMLDFGMQSAARQIEIGAAQGVTPPNGQAQTGANYAAAFRNDYLCPLIGGLLDCNRVAVNVAPVTDYVAQGAATLPKGWDGTPGNAGFSFCPGQPNQLMLVTAVYTSPSLVAPFVPSMAISAGGTFVHTTISTVAFVNEKFPVTAAPPPGC